MSSAGSSSSIAGNTSRTRAITRPISRRRPSASSRKTARNRGRQKAIKDELEWIRQGAKARQTKSKARIAKFEQLVEAQKNRTPGKAQIVIQVPERLGGKVIEVKNLSKAYGDKLLFEDLSLHAARRAASSA